MQYISTRNSNHKKTFYEVVMEGLPIDGGLYIPDKWPILNTGDLRNLHYSDLAYEIIYPYCGKSIEQENLRSILKKTYKKFHHPKTAPLFKLEENKYILELFYGPTFAFKDYALQFLGNLFEYFTRLETKKLTILGATSGDTGSAAIEAFKEKKNINIFILHPYEKVSDVQRLQMTTVIESNIHNLAIRGNFDDCQKILKQLFVNSDLLSKTKVSSVNSINWARIIAQTVYYYWSYFQIDNDINKKVNFIVPSGNFGNVYAARVAAKMGLPINKLHIATNSNDILHRIISQGLMNLEEVKKTLSPSMDIQVSSNFERQLFESIDYDSEKLCLIMKSFIQEGKYKIDQKVLSKLQSIYETYAVNDKKILETIDLYSKKYKYIPDPHTATGLNILENIKNLEYPYISLACAHPAKFANEIKKSINYKIDYPDSIKNIFEKKEQFTILDNNIMDVKKYILGKI